MKKDNAIVLLSGGLDSCVTATIAQQDYELYLLHVNYGQRTDAREEKAFKDIAKFYNITQILDVDIGYLLEIGGSSLIDNKIIIPVKSSEKEIPSTYVPFRNANLLAIATSWAEVIGAKKIFIGAMEEDSSGYPDCRESFFDSFNKTIEQGTKPGTTITIETPLLHRKKSEVVNIGMELGAPLHLTWSCYQNVKKACGVCESCQLRIKAFRDAGLVDPIPYSIEISWKE
ncbi:MAG TPA: 7-cyano-7-deazaguanine synthase QueC [Candidatus Cloacimonetes bacterium]|nr:7-cyano-7-deazaguanine synthase QueC [Candidatus Cloacimonadota bacterium]HEX38161.1 7-cyano-7-deazaguanine synthase QueC [Candidatus Cloacimonadota bacterium]